MYMTQYDTPPPPRPFEKPWLRPCVKPKTENTVEQCLLYKNHFHPSENSLDTTF